MAASSGTIIVSTDLPPKGSGEVNRTCWGRKRPVLLQRRVQLKRQPVNLYVKRGVLLSQCTNVAGFSLKSNEEHLLMANTLPSVRPVIVEKKTGSLKIDTDQQPVQLAYLVRVIPRCTVVTIGPDTSLSLLLSIGCLHVEQILLNGAQMFELLNPDQL